MKFFIYLGLFLSLISCNGNLKQELDTNDKAILKQAIDFGDVGVALNATYSLISRDSANISYFDTLATLYFNGKSFPQCISSAIKVLKKDPENTRMLLVMANSLKEVGRSEEALPYFMKLFDKTKNPVYSYESSIINFYGNRTEVAKQSALTILNTPGADKYFVVINLSEGRKQKVPISAALSNLLGFIAQKEGKLDEAKSFYQRSISIYPDFELAKNNLEGLEKK